MSLLDALRTAPSELITLAVGTVGGLVGFLVSDGKSITLGISSIIVGGFAAFTFTPLIIHLIELQGFKVVDDIRVSITGSIAAVSWQLVITMKAAIPALFNKLTGIKKKGAKK